MNKYKKIKTVNRDEHVLVMEEYLGRPLEKGEIVHHNKERYKRGNCREIIANSVGTGFFTPY